MTNQMIQSARGWIGTRFVHQGRVKKTAVHKGGCDCIGFVVGVLNEVGRGDIACHDKTDYARVPNGMQLFYELRKVLQQVPDVDMRAGDIALFKFDKNPQHVGIISETDKQQTLIHCYLQARGVVEHRFDEIWQKRLVAVFRID